MQRWFLCVIGAWAFIFFAGAFIWMDMNWVGDMVRTNASSRTALVGLWLAGLLAGSAVYGVCADLGVWRR